MQTIQYIHFSIEMWGALFSLVGALIVFLTRYFDKAGSRKLILVLFCSALLMISDGTAWLYRGNTTEAGYYIVRISNFASFFFGFLIMPLAAQYVSHLIYVRTNGVRLYWEIYEWGIFFFGSVLLIINAFVPFIYTFDETNTYQRSPYFFWLPGFIALVGALITLGVALAYHKYMMKLENAAIISFLALPIVAIILQIVFYGVSFANISIVISTVILVMTSLLYNKQNRYTTQAVCTGLYTYHVLSVQKRFFSADLLQGLEPPKYFCYYIFWSEMRYTIFYITNS